MDFDIDIGDVVLLKDGDIYQVTGVIHDNEMVYFYQGGNEVCTSFDDIDTLFKPVNN